MNNNNLFQKLRLMVKMTGNLKVIKQQNVCKKCVGFSILNNDINYAISGLDGYDKSTEALFLDIKGGIENILSKTGKKPNRCIIDNAIYSFSDDYDKVKTDEQKIYKIIFGNINMNSIVKFIYNYNTRSPQRFTPSIISYKANGNIKGNIKYRNWTCVERKIIGTIGHNNLKLFSSMKPCYFCLPEVKFIFFYNNLINQRFSMEVDNIDYKSRCEIIIKKI